MIKVTNQEEFEKCLPMLDSPDVECRLLGWELLCGCTDLHGDSFILWSYDKERKYELKFLISNFNKFTIGYIVGNIISVSYSSLINNFAKTSKIFFGKDYLTLRNEHTSQ